MTDEEKKQEEVIDQAPAEETTAEEVKVEETKPKEVSAEETKEEVKEEPKVEEASKEEEKKEVDMSKLSDTAVKVVEMVEKMAVLELAELVKVLEDKFGVSAAAPAAVAAAPGTTGGESAEEEKSEFNINVTVAGANKIGLIKAIRAVTDLGLKEAKDVAESLPKVIKEGVNKKEAEEIKKTIEESGATVELQ